MTKTKVSATLDEVMVKEIDQIRGLVSRSPFLEMLIQKGLKIYKEEKVNAQT